MIFIDSKVSLRPISPTVLGSNVTLYCDLFNELPDNVFWSKRPANSSNTINFINTNNIPIRYKMKMKSKSLYYSEATLTIYGIKMDDVAIFACTGSMSSKRNLTLARMVKI